MCRSLIQSGAPVLRDVSFTLQKKKTNTCALVGATGAGKSTVIKLINSFYQVTEGAILIDGENIESLSLGTTRRLISVVPQEGFLFHGDLRTNLRFGKPHATDDELWRALALVEPDNTIKKRGGLGER